MVHMQEGGNIRGHLRFLPDFTDTNTYTLQAQTLNVKFYMFIAFNSLSYLIPMLQASQEHYHHYTHGEIVKTKVTKPRSGRLKNRTY